MRNRIPIYKEMLLLRFFPSITRSPVTLFPFQSYKGRCRLYCGSREMGQDSSQSEVLQMKKRAIFRLCNVSSYTTEVLEICAANPTLHVLVIPGNPGIASMYKEFVESLYDLLGGTASVTAVGHIAHTKKSWEHGRLFSLQEQVNHKMDFIKQELQNSEVPIILVGHSIGSYISVEMFKRSPAKVRYCIGLYPFLALNRQSKKQALIGKLAASRILSVVLSFIVVLLGLLPIPLLKLVVTPFLGNLSSATAVEAACSHLVKYHTIRNVMFMAMTEFRELSETPDWAFMRAYQHKIAFLFAIDDHWGPLQMYEEMSKQVPDAAISVEREGLTDHGFCCSEVGSLWVAEHVATLIKNQSIKDTCPNPS